MPMEAYGGYLDLRKYGTVPHSGGWVIGVCVWRWWVNGVFVRGKALLPASWTFRKYGTMPHSCGWFIVVGGWVGG